MGQNLAILTKSQKSYFILTKSNQTEMSILCNKYYHCIFYFFKYQQDSIEVIEYS